MNLHLHRDLLAALRHLHITAYGGVAIVLSCAAIGATMGVLFPLRTKNVVASNFDGPGPSKAASPGSVENAASAVAVAKPDKAMSDQESFNFRAIRACAREGCRRA
jgi:hypothetical protein